MFAFDQLDEDMLLRLASAEIDMISVATGVIDIGLDVREGVRVRPHQHEHQDPDEVARQAAMRAADIAAGLPVGQYCSYSNLVEEFGEEAIAKMSRGEPRRSRASAEEFRRRSDAVKAAANKLFEELPEIRRRFLPEFDIADCRDGPTGYAVAVRGVIDRLFPPPSISRLIERVKKARRKLSHFRISGASINDRQEISQYVMYTSWFVDRFDILDATQAPPGPEVGFAAATEYLRAVENHLEKNKSRRLDYDTQIANYFREQDQEMLINKTNALVTLVQKNGNRIADIKAFVQPDLIIIKDTSVPVEEEDVIERLLPSKIIERFHVTDRGYFSAIGSFPEHYQVKVAKLPSAQSAVANNHNTTYIVSGQNARVVHGSDSSTNTIDRSQQFADWKSEIATSGASGADLDTLLKRIDDLEKAKDKKTALDVFSSFCATASKYAPLIPMIGKIAAWCHGIPV